MLDRETGSVRGPQREPAAMSYDQTFKGKFTFADAHCLEAGLDRFAAVLEDSIVGLDDLSFDGLTVAVDMDCSAPASMYDETVFALSELGSEAQSGSIVATFTLDGTEREQVRSGGRRSSQGLGPRHHRWELFAAAKSGDAAALRELASRGISLAQPLLGYHGWTALHLAARAGSVDAVQVLLDAGIEPDAAPSPTGMTPLSLAANAEVARRLLDAGADEDRPVGDSVALALACDDGRRDVVAVLLDAGAAIPESVRKDMVESCARSGDVGILHRFVAREPAFSSLLRESEVMDYAIGSGNPVMLDLLLEHGATLPETFVEDAIGSGSVVLAELALQGEGARERCGSSSEYGHAMCIAARDCNLAMMQLLARHGVPLYPEQPGETSPLHSAARAWEDNAQECVAWLLDQGVPIDALDQRGHTALEEAASSYRPQVATLLLERGADPSVLSRLDARDRKALRKQLGAKWATLVEAKGGTKKKPAAKKAAGKKSAAKKKVAKKVAKKPTKKKSAKKKSR
jgi:ankyrin repeat protein